MSLLLSDKQIKEKWLKDYMAEIKYNQERKEYEKNRKLHEEKLQLDKLNEELRNEMLAQKVKKEYIRKDNQNELDKFFLKKKDQEKNEILEKFNNVGKLTLPLKHEERNEKYKEYMSKLTDKIDYNMGNYKNYHSRNNSANLILETKSNVFKEDLKDIYLNRDFNATEKSKFEHNKLHQNQFPSSSRQENNNDSNCETKEHDKKQIYSNDFKYSDQKSNNDNNRNFNNYIIFDYNSKKYPNHEFNSNSNHINYANSSNDKNVNDINFNNYVKPENNFPVKYENFYPLKKSKILEELENNQNSRNFTNNSKNSPMQMNSQQFNNNNFEQSHQHPLNNNPPAGNESYRNPHHEKIYQIMSSKDNYRVNNIDNIGVNSSMFDYDKFNNKVFDQYQNYDNYNFNKLTRPVEKEFAINKNSLENIHYKDSFEYKKILKHHLDFNKEEMKKLNKNKIQQYQDIKPNIDDRLKDLENFRYQEIHNNYIKKQNQKMYKNFLDDQIKYRHIKLPSPINSDNGQINETNIFQNKSKHNLDCSFLDPLNPRNRFSIGDTKLPHNPIVYAAPDYKYNKYIYKDLYTNNDKESLSRSLIVNGNNIIQ